MFSIKEGLALGMDEQSLMIYRALADKLTSGVWIFDKDYTILYSNPVVETLLAYSAEELEGKNFISLLTDKAGLSFFQLDHHLKSEKQFQATMQHRNGHSLWCRLTLTTLSHAASSETGILAQIILSGEETSATPQNPPLDAHFLKIMSQFPNAGIFVFNQDLQIGKVYGNFYRENLTSADFEGRSIYEVYPESYAQSIEPKMRRALAGEIFTSEGEFRGLNFWTIYAPLPSADATIARGIILALNITAQKMAESSWQNSENLYRSLFNSYFEAFVILIDGIIVDANWALEELTGYKQGELVGHTTTIFIAPEQHSRVHERISQDKTNIVEFNLQRRDGTIIPIETQAMVISYQGKPARLAVLRDIRERHQLLAARLESERIQMELENANDLRRHKDFFLSMVSHEFRTPLAVIRSSTDILERYYERLSPEKRSEQFARITANLGKLSEMMEDILLLSRLEMNRVQFSPLWHDLIPFCENILADVSRTYPQTQVEFTTQLQSRFFQVDAYLLEHILQNLVGNAAKYSDNAKVRFEARQVDASLEFSIQDSGIGIPEDDLPHIFEAFYRAKNVDKRAGTGMGLAIVKRFVDLHEGEIVCDSELGKGTRFTLRIPAQGRY